MFLGDSLFFFSDVFGLYCFQCFWVSFFCSWCPLLELCGVFVFFVRSWCWCCLGWVLVGVRLYEISILGQIVLRAFGDASKAQPGTLKIIRKRVVRKVLDTIDDSWHKQDILTRNSPSNTRYSWKLHEFIWFIKIFSRNIRKTWVAE